MSNAVGIQQHDGPSLDTIVGSVRSSGDSSTLWQDLEDKGFTPQLSGAKSATVTIRQTGESYTYLTVPFTPGGSPDIQGIQAVLAWDNAKGSERSAHGIIQFDNGRVSSIAVYNVSNGSVEQYATVEGNASQIRVLDSRDNELQRTNLEIVRKVSLANGRPLLPIASADSSSDCGTCGTVVDIVYGAVAGSVLGYFICLTAGAGLGPAGVVIMGIVCGVIVALVLYLPSDAIKDAVCEPWCGKAKEKDAKEKDGKEKESKEKDGQEKITALEKLVGLEKNSDNWSLGPAAADGLVWTEAGGRPSFISADQRPRVE